VPPLAVAQYRNQVLKNKTFKNSLRWFGSTERRMSMIRDVQIISFRTTRDIIFVTKRWGAVCDKRFCSNTSRLIASARLVVVFIFVRFGDCCRGSGIEAT